MASYLVTGASRGLGFEFVRQLSENPENIVIGLVRDKATTDKKIDLELEDRTNLHIIQADLSKYASIQESVAEVSRITGGSLDVLIANAAFVSPWSAYDPLSKLGKDPTGLEKDLVDSFMINVVGNVHLFNLFTPLVLKGKVKKVISITTGMAEIELISKFGVAIAAPYSISKAAMNAATAKFSAEYSKDGVLFLSISPGLVDTGNNDEPTPEQAQGLKEMGEQFAAYAPHFTGPITPESSVRSVLSVIDRASVETGYGGAFVSHFGNKQWL